MGGDQGNAAAALRDGGIGRGQGLLCAGQLGLVHYPGKLGGHWEPAVCQTQTDIEQAEQYIRQLLV